MSRRWAICSASNSTWSKISGSGANEIDVVAVLHDGRERAVALRVDYHPGASTPELEKQLTLVRERNEALIDEIRQRLAREMEQQRKELDVSAGPGEQAR